MKINLSIIAVLYLAITSLFAQNFNIQKIDSLYDALEKKNKAMGTLAIAKNGQIIYKRSIGFSFIDEKEKISANENTLYNIGSTTKMFTATMIFQLIDEKILALNTKLSDFFPAVPNAENITIETLLNHRNGLYDFVNDQKDLEWITKPQSKEIILEQIVKNKPHFKPNEEFSYSNSGFLLLAYIIEKTTNLSYNENLQRRICQKIGLEKTYSPVTNERKRNEATSYSYVKNSWIKINDIYFPNVTGVGDILSTPLELIKFNEALLAGKFFSEASLTEMKTFTDESFGMGIMKFPFYSHRALGHGGDTYGTHTMVSTFLKDSLTIASCINGQVLPHNDLLIGVLSICYEKPYSRPAFNEIALTADELDKYIGVYSSKQMPLKITVTKEKTTLMAQATGQSSFPLEAVDTDKFEFTPASIIMEFAPVQNELILKQGGGKFLFTKEKEN